MGHFFFTSLKLQSSNKDRLALSGTRIKFPRFSTVRNSAPRSDAWSTLISSDERREQTESYAHSDGNCFLGAGDHETQLCLQRGFEAWVHNDFKNCWCFNYVLCSVILYLSTANQEPSFTLPAWPPLRASSYTYFESYLPTLVITQTLACKWYNELIYPWNDLCIVL